MIFQKATMKKPLSTAAIVIILLAFFAFAPENLFDLSSGEQEAPGRVPEDYITVQATEQGAAVSYKVAVDDTYLWDNRDFIERGRFAASCLALCREDAAGRGYSHAEVTVSGHLADGTDAFYCAPDDDRIRLHSQGRTEHWINRAD